MLVAGDEFGRTQLGNNNAYCQDNEISWLNWLQADKQLFAFTQQLIHLRKRHPVFCRRRWFQGVPIKGGGLGDIAWFLPEGVEMEEHNWNEDFAKSLAIYLNGQGLRSTDPKGEKITDDNFYLMFNAHHEHLHYTLPHERYGKEWLKVLDTGTENIDESPTMHFTSDTIRVEGRSIVLLKHVKSKEENEEEGK